MSEITQGTRVLPNADGWLDSKAINAPASYGRCTNPRTQGGRTGWWMVTAPNGDVGSINPDIHSVIEHEDGTITVAPSIDYSKRGNGVWHGWLERGIFRSV